MDSVPPVESEPIRAVSPLWMTRCFALICVLIGAGGLFHEAVRAGADFRLADWVPYFVSLFPYLAVLCLLFLRGKNPFAFALGMATTAGFLGGGVGVLGRVLVWICVVLTNLSASLLWLFFISSMMLGLSAYWTFNKLRLEEKGTPWRGFGGGVFAAVLLLGLAFAMEAFASIGALR